MIKVGYLGPSGTFSEQAFHKYKEQSNQNFEGLEGGSFFDLFMWLTEKKCDQIIVPYENSVEGSVTTILDLLVHTPGFTIEQELMLPIENYLLGFQEEDLKNITDIFSHPQPLAQCQKYIFQNFPEVKTHAFLSTRHAANMAVAIQKGEEPHFFNDAKNHTVGVVGNKQLCALLPELKILVDNHINDYASNITRFIVLGTTETNPTGFDKTSIVFAIEKDKPGGLYNILGEFANRNINLTKIASRPTKEVLGEYLFFIDCEGHIKEAKIKEALDIIKQKTSYFKILGSYKMAEK